MRVELGHAAEVLVGFRQGPLLLEDDTRAEVGVAMVGISFQDCLKELEGLVEVAQSGTAAAGRLGGLDLLAGHVQEGDGQVDRAGNPARRPLVDLAKGLGRLAVLVLLHESGALEMSRQDKVEFGRGNLVRRETWVVSVCELTDSRAVWGTDAAGSSLVRHADEARQRNDKSSVRKHRPGS